MRNNCCAFTLQYLTTVKRNNFAGVLRSIRSNYAPVRSRGAARGPFGYTTPAKTRLRNSCSGIGTVSARTPPRTSCKPWHQVSSNLLKEKSVDGVPTKLRVCIETRSSGQTGLAGSVSVGKTCCDDVHAAASTECAFRGQQRKASAHGKRDAIPDEITLKVFTLRAGGTHDCFPTTSRRATPGHVFGCECVACSVTGDARMHQSRPKTTFIHDKKAACAPLSAC